MCGGTGSPMPSRCCMQVSLQTKKIAPVGLKRIGCQPAFNPQLTEIPFKQEGPAMVPLVQPWASDDEL